MAVSREEYLKRYLSGPTQEKKRSNKKASKAVVRKAGLKILDDDIDFKSLLPNNIKNSLDDDLADDNPVVIDLGLDDRPEQVKELERMRNSKRWKVVAQDKDDSEPEIEIGRGRESLKKNLENSNSSSDIRKNDKRRYDSESDASAENADDSLAQRKQGRGHSSDTSPPRRTQVRDPSSDNSPPRKKGKDSAVSVNHKRNRSTHSDNSPPRRRKDGRVDSDSDVSPPRKENKSASHSFQTKQRKDITDQKHNRSTHSDSSPPRRRKDVSVDSDSDISPPRKENKSAMHSFETKQRKDITDQKRNRNTHSDSSPPRRRKDGRVDSDSDMSPPRKENKSAMHSFETKQRKDTTDQRHDATDIPQVIYRKDGKKRDLQTEKKLKEEEDAKRAALAAKYKEWNKGLKQKEIVQERIADGRKEMEKPLARYRDDQDLDSHLRAQLREEDPMLAFIKKKKSTAKGAEKPKYRGPQPPPNRFNILPGYRWDGVDRSNGFEKKFFSKISEDKAVKDVAYKWSVEDM